MYNLTAERADFATGLRVNNNITKNEEEAIIKSPSKPSPIYYLPKIHKKYNKESNTFAGRPIVATYNCVTHLLDKYLTEITAPLLSRIPGSLMDTTDLLKKLPSCVPKNCFILTSDVNALYPSIPWSPGIEAATNFYVEQLEYLKDFFKKRNKLEPPNATFFKAILKFILENSIIHFQNNRFFHQKLGTAMGMCVSVYFANTYMYQITRKHIDNPPPYIHAFYRYIDDILLLTSGSEEQTVEFFRDITNEFITYESSSQTNMAEFLDLKTIINKHNEIETELYSKPTSTPFFLHAKSSHPLHTIASIPYAQLLRIRRNTSKPEVFIEKAKSMMKDFGLRGYSPRIIKAAFLKIMATSRESLFEPSKAAKKHGNISSALKMIQPYSTYYNWRFLNRKLRKIHFKIILFYRDYPNRQVALRCKPLATIFSKNAMTNSALTKKYKNPKILS